MDDKENKKEENINNINDDMKPDNEPYNVTREINLDELYDGAINNTVVIDPVTNDEVLMTSKKTNYTFIGVLLSILVLLGLYYINNKSEIGKENKEIKPNTTVSKPDTNQEKSGILTCNYSLKSDAESQTVTYNLYYNNEKLLNSEFNYVVVSNLDESGEMVNDLTSMYESFYINNSNSSANNITFEKNEKGFSFNVKTDYTKNNIELNKDDSENMLYVMPTISDTYSSLNEAYTNKGFTCTLTSNDKE